MKFSLERTDNVVRIKTELFEDGTVYEKEYNLKTEESECIDYSTDFMADLFGRTKEYEECVNIATELEKNIQDLTSNLKELELEEMRINALSYNQR